MSTREVITLQFGHYANFVGTHFWNAQQAQFTLPSPNAVQHVDHDVLFRSGQTRASDDEASASSGSLLLSGNQTGAVISTYTPRLLAFDLKGSLSTMSKVGAGLYSEYSERPSTSSADQQAAWAGNIQRIEQSTAQKHPFMAELDADYHAAIAGRPRPQRERFVLDYQNVRFWSDVCVMHLHPRSVQLTSKFVHHSSIEPFDLYGHGSSVWADPDFQDKVETDLHFFAEECDSLHGFHILADVASGFGGLTESVLSLVADEYGSKSRLVFGLSPYCHNYSDDLQQETYRAKSAINNVLSTAAISELASCYVPVSDSILNFSPPGLNARANSWYHSSAVVASLIDTVTLPYRLTKQHTSIHHILSVLALGGARGGLAGLAAATRYPRTFSPENLDKQLESAPSYRSSDVEAAFTSFTPGVSVKGDIRSQFTTLRGILKGLSGEQTQEVFSHFAVAGSLSQACDTSSAFPLEAPFPCSVFGYASASEIPTSHPVIASLRSGGRVSSGAVNHAVKALRDASYATYAHEYDNCGVSRDDLTEARESLLNLRDTDSDDVDF
ncbi:hypothetical protein CAOG_09115 [Capsaspora owczarzaki ATCC 30864]|nr:hypothetical protein CAOG_09115 [Capsaspora owczarzaki ATCC 30864]|eukprot:XP_011270772.1 hypothetical protein CAOG_09115 [Capsaspora owczarzaki ATCC 30864]